MIPSIRAALRHPWLHAAWLLALLSGTLCAQAPAETVLAPALPALSAYTHRPLRDNQPLPAVPVPMAPEEFKGYPAAPPFSVVTRRENILLYPCSQCHNLLPLNTLPRKLIASPHQATLQHGGGRFWCLDCHQAKDRQWLRTIDGDKVDFNDSSRLCGQCHGARQRDWAFGAHGKRVAGWNGERQIYACTHCHDPHSPVLKLREAQAVPPVRAGLAPMQRSPHERVLPWQRATNGKHE